LKNHQRSIALFGTSADPPTKGHEQILLCLLNIFPKVVTWASNNPFKLHHYPKDVRSELLNLLVEDINNASLFCKQEISDAKALNTINKAKKLFPHENFTFIIGSDLLNQITSWHEYQKVLAEITIGIVPRKDYPIDKEKIIHLTKIGGKFTEFNFNIPSYASSNFHLHKDLEQLPISIAKKIIL